MRSYMQEIGTLDMADAVSRRLAADPNCSGFETDTGRLLYEILRVGSDENVYEIQVAARSTNPAEANCVSSTWAQEFVDRREQVNLQLLPLDRIVTEARDQTTLERIRPRRRLLVLAGVALGAVVAGVLVLVLEYFESAVIRGPDDAKRVSGLPLLAVLPTGGGGGSSGSVRQGLVNMNATALHGIRWGWPILALALLGAVAGVTLTSIREPVYRARTRIAVEPARGSDWGQTQAIREIMRGFSEDIATLRMATEVNAREQLDLPPDDLLSKLDAAPNESIYEIYVDVKDADEEVARQVSRAWAALFVEERATANLELDQQDRILTRLRDHTVAELWAPKLLPNVLAGLAIGALIGAAALYALHLSKSGRINTPRDAAQASGTAVIGIIPPRR
jgi:capsular polysaccharide biosynthesis protein